MTMKEKRAARRAVLEAAEKATDPVLRIAPADGPMDPATRRALLTIGLFVMVTLIVIALAIVGSTREAEARRACAARGGHIADVHGGSGWVCLASAP